MKKKQGLDPARIGQRGGKKDNVTVQLKRKAESESDHYSNNAFRYANHNLLDRSELIITVDSSPSAWIFSTLHSVVGDSTSKMLVLSLGSSRWWPSLAIPFTLIMVKCSFKASKPQPPSSSVR